ncbi:hypothetical protein HMPREF0175_1685 [Bifidobacterium longum subsp. longum ATCC 55813]|uniref:Uncharacterized protein n=1 Tax=Bifidobacterium longum subsp. longum 2-2B TaxID=1161745 RepID=A0AAV3FMS6_BIFLL|nr:hypothetical protein BLNIAS_01376 [Bifidobacterium longum subsp. longum KACC 91563]EEI80116.1 hypothetical protein HMPREF0175_1685 [Bifidobacterium longum subsp. longum ATCC 55813]EIJ25564.1 hypothetical protein HMPREF1314_1807 [Bifidobacterium longum subsp. longum 35B]EIJ26828.1 hypothetical protein HMPREF1315_1175 [Bifidobacterium longum subsp. longum 2-2B]KWZ90040.1 hypothetical protein HMPREF3231_01527 [Bifidobacterium longum]
MLLAIIETDDVKRNDCRPLIRHTRNVSDDCLIARTDKTGCAGAAPGQASGK